MTQAELLAQRDALTIARSSGQLRVVFHSGGTRREIEYRSVAEIEKAIAAIDRDMAANAGTRINTIVFHTSKGL